MPARIPAVSFIAATLVTLPTAARAQGLAQHDFAIVYRVLARLAGINE